MTRRRSLVLGDNRASMDPLEKQASSEKTVPGAYREKLWMGLAVITWRQAPGRKQKRVEKRLALFSIYPRYAIILGILRIQELLFENMGVP